MENEMNIMQMLINAGINAFGAQLLAESYLRSPLAEQAMQRGEPVRFFLPIHRSDCAGWSGVEISIAAVPDPDRAEIRVQADLPANAQLTGRGPEGT
jgi:hypothetical protein